MRKLGFIIAGVLALSYGTSASAQTSQLGGFTDNDDFLLQELEEEERFREQRDRQLELREQGREMSDTARRHVTLATQAAQEGDFEALVVQSDKGLSEHGLTSYEKSVLFQLGAAGHLKLGNYHKARESYEYAVATQGMNEAEITQVNKLIAQLDAAGVQ